jgi:hypothetical protein
LKRECILLVRGTRKRLPEEGTQDTGCIPYSKADGSRDEDHPKRNFWILAERTNRKDWLVSMEKNMKRPLLIFLAAMIMAIPSQGYSDAPVETYFLGVTQIPDNVLRETKAVLTVNIIDPKAYAEYYNQPNVKQTPYIAVYKKEGNSFKKMGVLEKAQIKTPTGGEYGPKTWYRLPVTNSKGEYFEIIYDIFGNKKLWVNFSELKSSLSGEKPILDWFATQPSTEPVSVDIFFLTRNKEIRVFASPTPGSPSQALTPQSEILRTNEVYDDRAFQIIERKNGFGHLGVNQGCDRPARSIGWIRLRDEKGRLLVWPITGLGC